MQYHRSKDTDSIVCLLCKHYCTLKEGKSGVCGVNFNLNSTLFNSVYSHPSALNLDPIEKKPLYHFHPSSTSLSLGTVGCNFRCPFCQNHSISQMSKVDTSHIIMPADIVRLALQHKAKSISYTYNEPTIWYPYAKDIGVLAKENGLLNVFVSSGYESKEVLEEMSSWVDAVNIDLKSFSKEYYKKVLKTDLEGVLETLKTLAKSPIHLEVTTLVIPGVNDSTDELTKMANFITNELGDETVWHLSAFHPDYKMLDTPRTPLETLQKAKNIALKAGLQYVYLGNIRNDSSTYCPKCHAKLITRDGFKAETVGMNGSQCAHCGHTIKGVFS
jgi:pyruvate formate lyase activating enzyme